MELTYETASQQDVASLYQLNKALIEAYEDLTAIDFEKVLAWVHRKISENISGYTRICRDGHLVGYYRLVPCAEGLELDDFYILEPFRGQGIGSQVLRRCCESDVPLILYVFTKNTRAIRLYRRFGFHITQAVSPTRYIMCRPATAPQEDL